MSKPFPTSDRIRPEFLAVSGSLEGKGLNFLTYLFLWGDLIGEPEFEHCPLGRESLTGHRQPQPVEAREGRQIGTGESGVEHVEVSQVASFRTSVIGGPRSLSPHRNAHSSIDRYSQSTKSMFG